MERRAHGCLVLLLAVFAIQAVFGFDLEVSPRRMTVKPGDRVSILCRASEPLTGCRFLLPDDCVVDLSDGALSANTTEYHYYGIGLEQGQCGITMVGLDNELFTTIACQARTARDGWKRAAMFLRVTSAPTIQWDVEYDNRVALPGQDVTVLCHTDVPLTTCRFGLMNGKHWVDLSSGSRSKTTGGYSYYGQGLEKGQCGIKLHKVTEAMSGEVRCIGIAEGNRTAGDFVSLAVAKPSDVPELSISSKLYGEFDAMKASCTVRNSIPAPKITWFVGNDVITGGIIDDSPNDVWFDHNEQKVVQNLTRRVSCEDNGKELQCVAGPRLIAKAKINVNCVSTFKFTASPKSITVPLGATTSFLCRANKPLTGCRFLLPGNRVVDLRDGVPSTNETEYRYYGTGLANGQCGITLRTSDTQMYSVLACQGRTERAGWKRDAMFLRVTNLPTIQWDVDYPTGIVIPGQEIILMCQSNVPLKVCRFALMNGQLWVDVSQGHQSTATQEYAYFGNGLEYGHCGVKLYRATEEMSGETRCVGITPDNRWAGGYISLAIAKPPADVELTLNANRYSENDVLTASCAVRNSQPAANISWYFGDDFIRDGIRDDSPDDVWFRHNDQTVVQELTRKLTCLDNGKDLTCVAGPRYYKATKKITMNGCKTIPQSNRPTVTKLEPAEPFFTTQDGVEKACGIPLLSNQLIVQGQATVYGHWPWTVAMFMKKTREGGLQFLCGGTLINKKHVITAAHCIQSGSGRPLDRDDIVLFVGKYNLNDWTEPHNQLKRIASIHVYPDYTTTKNGSDIAMLVLSEPVVYSDYVRPICLWDKSSALDEVVGHEGTVVGWGRFGASDSFVSDVPRRATAIIVSQDECVRSNPDLAQITSERTLCAGYKDGGGPCNGDSGSGLVIPYRPGNTGPVQWFLRGIVSLSLLDSVDQVCDLTQYVIYTDAAKYSKWIEQFNK